MGFGCMTLQQARPIPARKNQWKKPYKFNRDGTICRSCYQVASEPAVRK